MMRHLQIRIYCLSSLDERNQICFIVGDTEIFQFKIIGHRSIRIIVKTEVICRYRHSRKGKVRSGRSEKFVKYAVHLCLCEF